ncbi:hypothetical protein IHI24_000933 [Rickettsia endosymbiont of Cardiosporidium cionae]|nr:hypothetical protein IHI24_000933 [Rickettsia endosymbiont of Cardiosporidium cionae]
MSPFLNVYSSILGPSIPQKLKLNLISLLGILHLDFSAPVISKALE